MNKKKILAVLVAAAALSTSFVSCSDDDNKKRSKKESRKKSEVVTEEETTEAEEETEATTKAKEAEEMKMMSAKDIANLPVTEYVSPELKEIGSFEVGDLRFLDGNFIFTQESDDVTVCYDYMGKKLFDGAVLNIERMGDSDLFSFSVRDGDMVYQGLMDSEGNEVFPADKGVGLFASIDDRFFTAYFPEGITEDEDEDEAIYYVTSSMFSFMPQDGDTLYKGTVKVFDSKTGKFLEKTTESFDPHYSVKGDVIYYYNEDIDPVLVSDADKLLELPSGFSVTGGFLTSYEHDSIAVYDHQLNKLFASPYSISELYGNKDFYTLYDSDNEIRGLMYKNGEMVLKPEYRSIGELCDGYFTYQPTEDYQKNGIIKVDGTVLTEPIYKSIYCSDDLPGYFNAQNSDGTYDILDGEGNVIRSSTTSGIYSDGYITEDNDYYYLVRGTGEFSLKLSYSTYLDDQILYNSSGKTVYDLVTGEKLFEGVDKAYRIYGYLYIIKDGKATVYEVN